MCEVLQVKIHNHRHRGHLGERSTVPHLTMGRYIFFANCGRSIQPQLTIDVALANSVDGKPLLLSPRALQQGMECWSNLKS